MDSARHVIKRVLNSAFVSEMVSYDVASTVHQSLGGGGGGQEAQAHARGRAAHAERAAAWQVHEPQAAPGRGVDENMHSTHVEDERDQGLTLVRF
jgi:hypothetical protein